MSMRTPCTSRNYTSHSLDARTQTGGQQKGQAQCQNQEQAPPSVC